MTVLTPGSLPLTISSASTQGEFDSDATVGVFIEAQRYVPLGTRLAPRISHPDVHGGARGMWFVLGLDEAGTLIEFGPEDADEFSHYTGVVVDGVTCELFEWRVVRPNVTGPAGNEPQFWVRIAVGIDPAFDDELAWFGWIGRENSVPFTVLTFVYPHLVVQNFATPRAAENNWQAAGRCRFMLPIATHAIAPWIFGNYPMNCFASASRQKQRCPGVLKLPFMGLCSCNDAGAEYLLNFTVRAKRTRPDQVAMIWQPLNDGASPPKFSYMEMSLGHTSIVAKELAHKTSAADGFHPEDYETNTMGPRYRVVTETFLSLSPSFWHDICERNRTHFISAASPTKISATAALSTSRITPRHLHATWIAQQTEPEELAAMENYVDYAEILELMFAPSSTPMENNIAHQQTYLKAWSAGVVGEQVPPEEVTYKPNWTPGSIEAQKLLRRLGWRCSIYSNVRYFPGAPILWAKLADYAIPGFNLESGARFLYDNVAHRLRDAWLTVMAQPAVQELELGGILFDTYTGAARLWHRLASSFPRDHENGGGPTNSEERFSNIDYMRGVLKAMAPFYGSGDSGFTVLTETSEEFAHSHTDMAGPGYFFQPGHFVSGDAEATMNVDVLGLPFFHADSIKTDYPAACRALHPWYFRICHHEWFPEFQFPMDFFTEVLATEKAPDPGLTNDEWIDFVCSNRALQVVQGGQVFMHTIYLDPLGSITPQYRPMFRIVNGQLVVRDATIDPVDGAFVISAFMQQLWDLFESSYGREFVFDGQWERPLDVDYTNVFNESEKNPTLPIKGLLNWPFIKGGLFSNWPFYHEVGAGNLRVGNNDFEFPRILHTVWRNRATGQLGVVIVNWSRSSSTWEAYFDPSYYGIAGAYSVYRRVIGGPPVLLAGGLVGVSQWISDSVPGGAVYLGHIAAHSVDVLEITVP